MNKIKLKKNSDRRLRNGHHWIFSNELSEIPAYEPGVVDVYDSANHHFGKALYNRNSLISARLLFSKNDIDESFILNRIKNAVSYRESIFPNEECVRLIFGESDLLPGLIVDKYGDYLAVQILSSGMESLKSYIYKGLISTFPDLKGIIQKNSNSYRELEGLTTEDEIIFGEIPEQFISSELGIKLAISLIFGQKTGYFLDQKLNRYKLRELSKDKSILDCFCNQGGFALNATFAGAKEVLGIDISKTAIEQAKHNAELNNFTNCKFEVADVFEYLEKAVIKGEKWDIVIIDPPAFAKSRKSLATAIKGYAKINKFALLLLNEGGYLVTSSCSQLLDENTFLETINSVASKQNKLLKVLFRGGQSPDHPIISSMKETDYLKFFIFKVLNRFS